MLVSPSAASCSSSETTSDQTSMSFSCQEHAVLRRTAKERVPFRCYFPARIPASAADANLIRDERQEARPLLKAVANSTAMHITHLLETHWTPCAHTGLSLFSREHLPADALIDQVGTRASWACKDMTQSLFCSTATKEAGMLAQTV